MKKLLFILVLLPALAFGQAQTDAQLITQINNTIRGKTFDAKRHADMFKTIVDSKVNSPTLVTDGALVLFDGTTGKQLTELSPGSDGDVLTLSGGYPNWIPATSYTFSNGITDSGGAITLGGSLTGNTTISGGATRSMSFSSLTSFNVSSTNLSTFGNTNRYLEVSTGTANTLILTAKGTDGAIAIRLMPSDGNTSTYAFSVGTTAAGGASNFIGPEAGSGSTGVLLSNFIGSRAGYQTGSVGIANFIGYQSGYQATNASNSNFLGFNTGRAFTSNNVGSNNIIIGTNISLPNAVTNSINLGGILFGINTYATTTGDPSITPTATGSIGIGVVTPTARLHLPAGTTTIAPLKISTGTALTTPQDGAIEYHSSHLYFTIGSTRYQLDQQGGGGIGGTTGSVDNAILRADGTGGSTLQASSVFITDTGDFDLGSNSISGTERYIAARTSSTGNNLANLNFAASGYLFSANSTFLSFNQQSVGVGILRPSNGSDELIISGSDNVTGVLRLGGISATSTNGNHIYITGGEPGSGATVYGNVGLFVPHNSSVSNWQGMQNGLYIRNRLAAPTAGIANGIALHAADVGSNSEFFITTESGAEVNISGLLTPVLLSGTSLTLSELHRNKIIYCTSGSAVTITVPASLQLGFNCIILQDGAGTVTLNVSAVTLKGKSATTGNGDTIALTHYKATDNYLGR